MQLEGSFGRWCHKLRRLLKSPVKEGNNPLVFLQKSDERRWRKHMSQNGTKSNGTIVLLEDDKEFGLTLKETLEDEGYVISLFKDGKQALSYLLAHESRVSGIICDLMMPGMDGIDFLAALRSDPRIQHLPLIFLSGSDIGVFSNLIRPYTYSAFLSKPVTTAELCREVDRSMRKLSAPQSKAS